jgi:hypothetical protein
VYGSVANNMSNAGLQFIAIKLDKDSFSLPEAYVDYINVFDFGKTAKLQTQTHTTHIINLKNRTKAPYGPIYYLFKLKLRTLRDYLAENEQKK